MNHWLTVAVKQEPWGSRMQGIRPQAYVVKEIEQIDPDVSWGSLTQRELDEMGSELNSIDSGSSNLPHKISTNDSRDLTPNSWPPSPPTSVQAVSVRQSRGLPHMGKSAPFLRTPFPTKTVIQFQEFTPIKFTAEFTGQGGDTQRIFTWKWY